MNNYFRSSYARFLTFGNKDPRSVRQVEVLFWRMMRYVNGGPLFGETTMKVGVGSKNKTKVDAVAEALRDYPMFVDAEVNGVDVAIEQFGHPKSLDETVAGAVDRAKQAQVGHNYGFGIESGLMKVPQTKSGYMEVAVCAIYDGNQIHMGLSQAYEWPKAVLDGILNNGLDGSQALKAAGITHKEKLGEHEGFVGLFSKGRTNRTEYNKGAIIMALMHLENPEHF